MAPPLSGWYPTRTGTRHYVDPHPSVVAAARCGTVLRRQPISPTWNGPLCGRCVRLGAPLPVTPEAPCP